MADRVKAIKNEDADNVVTVFGDVSENETIDVFDKKGGKSSLRTVERIPYGHKAALVPIKKSDLIIKYGEEIGMASSDIKVGEHVHIHNIESRRGRGDWDNKGTERP